MLTLVDMPNDQRLAFALALLAMGKRLRYLHISVYTSSSNASNMSVILNTYDFSETQKLNFKDPGFENIIKKIAESYDQIFINIVKSNDLIPEIAKCQVSENSTIVLFGQIGQEENNQILGTLQTIGSPEKLWIWLDKRNLDKTLLAKLAEFNFAITPCGQAIQDACDSDKQGFGRLLPPILEIIKEYIQRIDCNKMLSSIPPKVKQDLKNTFDFNQQRFFPAITEENSQQNANQLSKM